MKVLVLNDDGPPDAKHSPFVSPFVAALRNQLGWEVVVVLPHCNQSWTGKSIQTCKLVTKQTIKDDGSMGEDWILLDTSPAGCANIALTHLFTDIDLVICGPNLGRNAGEGSTISSGTLAAAIEASLLRKKAIALSFAYFNPANIQSRDIVQLALKTSCHLIKQLYEGWNDDSPCVFNLNVPLIDSYQGIEWTQFQRAGYHSLYKQSEDGFIFAPKFTLDPNEVGTDFWALANGYVSITPFNTKFDTHLMEAIPLKLE